MASSAPLLHCLSRFVLRNGYFASASHSSSPSSSNCISLTPSCPSFLNQRYFSSGCKHRIFAGVNSKRKHQALRAQGVRMTQGSLSSPRNIINVNDEPEHLLVLVHGLNGSPNDWVYVEAELKRHLGKDLLVYVSSSNTHLRTFMGIDQAGNRLAAEVVQIVEQRESLKKISFVAHSLGGLIARYAIAVLYSPNAFGHDQSNHSAPSADAHSETSSFRRRGTIAGLEPINFITLATPHLGVRGKQQLPFILGIPVLEKLAPQIAFLFAGQTGNQLFLADGKANKLPLLLRMASNNENGKFISALGAFRCRAVYANVSYDLMVGWRTSSIRREMELIKPPFRSLDGYNHVMYVEYCPPVRSRRPYFSPEAAKAKEAAQSSPAAENLVEFHEIMEEEMVRGLQQLGWKKIDVNFHSAWWPFFAHNHMNVKNEWLNYAGAEVVAHVLDGIKQQGKEEDTASFTAATL